MNRRAFIIFVVGFFALWTLAWLLHQWLVYGAQLWTDKIIELTYWVVMKFCVWLFYPWLYWRRRLPNIRDHIGLTPSTQQRGYAWGMVATGIWVSLSLVVAKTIQHLSFVGVDNWATFIYIITLTPIIEEIMFRGFILSGLRALGMEGKRANLLTTVLFLLVHCLGWAFQGVFLANMSSTVWVGITLFSIVAGFVRIHSGSLRAAIILHIGNNTVSGLLS